MSDVYRKIRLTLRFLLGNVHDFDLAKDVVPHSQLPLTDRYLLSRFAALLTEAQTSYSQYQFSRVYQVHTLPQTGWRVLHVAAPAAVPAAAAAAAADRCTNALQPIAVLQSVSGTYTASDRLVCLAADRGAAKSRIKALQSAAAHLTRHLSDFTNTFV